VILERNVRVEGNIHTTSLTLRDGGIFKGFVRNGEEMLVVA